MLTPEDHRKFRCLGHAIAMAELARLVRDHAPLEGVESFFAGMAEGISESVKGYLGEAAGVIVLQAAADRAGMGRSKSRQGSGQ